MVFLPKRVKKWGEGPNRYNSINYLCSTQ